MFAVSKRAIDIKWTAFQLKLISRIIFKCLGTQRISKHNIEMSQFLLKKTLACSVNSNTFQSQCSIDILSLFYTLLGLVCFTL